MLDLPGRRRSLRYESICSLKWIDGVTIGSPIAINPECCGNKQCRGTTSAKGHVVTGSRTSAASSSPGLSLTCSRLLQRTTLSHSNRSLPANLSELPNLATRPVNQRSAPSLLQLTFHAESLRSYRGKKWRSPRSVIEVCDAGLASPDLSASPHAPRH